MSKKRRMSLGEITDYINAEYIFNKELNSGSELSRYLSLLSDNGKAIKIEGIDDLYFVGSLSKYKVISLFLQKYDKSLKEHRRELTEDEKTENKTRIDNFNNSDMKDIEELNSSGLDIGTYSVVLEDEKSDEFAIFEIDKPREYDNYTIHYRLYLVGNKCEKYKKKLFKLIDKYQKFYDAKEELKTSIIYSESGIKKEVQFKSFDKMIFSKKDEVLSYIDNWKENIPKYYKYDMPAKLSILLYGNPGTGKSTFYKALAKYLGIKNIISIEPEKFYYNSSKAENKRIADSDTEKLYAIDEIDCICKTRSDKSKDADNDKVLSKLLAFLDNPPTFWYKANDGLYYPVSVIVATTNYINKIDPAVKRFGRFDLQIEMVDFNKEQAEDFCKLYDLGLSDVVNTKIDNTFKISPAKLQALCMENIDKSLKG